MYKKTFLSIFKCLVLPFAIFLSACTSEYVPSEKTTGIKKTMTTAQAVEHLQYAIWDIKEPQGICGARGFWYDNNADLKVHSDHINMLSHRRGKVLRKHDQKMGEIIVFEKAYYEYKFDFKDVIKINIVNDYRDIPTFPQCNKKDTDQAYRIIDLFVSKEISLKFIVFNDEFDKLMAAIELLFPGVRIYIK